MRHTIDDILRQHGLDPPSSAPGRYYVRCPRCSNTRTGSNRNAKCLGITISDDGVRYGCNHCGFTGGGKLNGKANGGDHTNSFAATFDYVDEAGSLLFQVCKTRDKEFPQRRPNGHGGWIWNTKAVRKVLYRLPELIEAIANDHTILIVEGEKDVESLRRINICATCNPGGASKPGQQSKWRKEFSETLRGADIIIIPDNDEAGRAHADAISRMSAGIANRVRLLDLAQHWPECPKGGDISDWLGAGHTREELDVLIEKAPDCRGSSSNGTGLESGSENIMGKNFPPIKYVVPGVIVEGLTLLAGKPKTGKSWLMLHAAIAVAQGGFTLGQIKCPQGAALYCALEDNERRIQQRIRKLFGHDCKGWPGLRFRCEMARLAEGGLEVIREWAGRVENPRMVVIDTLAMVRTPRKKDQAFYDADYAAVQELRTLANQHGIAIVVIHHLRKAEAEDPLDTISGTLGLSGAPDTVLVLKRDANGGYTLHGRGRDVADLERAMTFNPSACTWTMSEESASTVRRSNERQAILEALQANGELRPTDIAAATKMRPGNVRVMLLKMVRDGEIQRTREGSYRAPQA
jgi:AAA domain